MYLVGLYGVIFRGNYFLIGCFLTCPEGDERDVVRCVFTELLILPRRRSWAHDPDRSEGAEAGSDVYDNTARKVFHAPLTR